LAGRGKPVLSPNRSPLYTRLRPDARGQLRTRILSYGLGMGLSEAGFGMGADCGGREFGGLQILVRRFDSGPGLQWLSRKLTIESECFSPLLSPNRSNEGLSSLLVERPRRRYPVESFLPHYPRNNSARPGGQPLGPALRQTTFRVGLCSRLCCHRIPIAQLALQSRQRVADIAGLQIPEHRRHWLVRAEPLEQLRSLELREAMALRAVQPHHRPIYVIQAIGALRHALHRVLS
jgi:hypothetical protein